MRPYAYDAVGFFRDDELREVVSSEGEDGRHAVEIAPGDVLFAGDDEGGVFRIDVREKVGRATIELDITRVR